MEKMFYFYYYSIVSGVALIVHLIVNWRQLLEKVNSSSRAWAVEFKRFLICLSIFFVLDICWGILAELKWRLPLYINTMLFFSLMALCVHAWMRFVAGYLEVPGRVRTFLVWLGRVVLLFFSVALILNISNGCFFTIDSSCVYAEGPIRDFTLCLLGAFNALGSAVTMFMLRHVTGAMRRRSIMVLAFGLTMLAAILLQLGHPFLPIYALGCLFGCCLMHVFVFEDESDELHQKELLARDYQMRLEAERATNHAKSLFFSSVSHDIRTPLNAILGFSELLEQGVGDADERNRYISSIRSSGKVLARLVDDVLDLSKLESGKLEILEEPSDVPAIVREVISACEVARSRKSLLLKVELDDMPWVSVDPQRIRQILFNLLSNAYKYTDRGTVTVTVRWSDGTLALSVADTGVGISKENLPRILEPFVQVVDRNNRNGTGLGLPICNRLAQLMGGELKVESTLGAGSTFTVTLRNVKTVEPPAKPARRAAQTAAPSPEAGNIPAESCRVLVVDDSSVNRMVLKSMLAKCGVREITMAENGSRALEILRGGAQFDLVLTDLWMPQLDGFGLKEAVRADEKLAHLPLYLITADVEVRNQAEAEGFADILFKPISLDKLKPLLASVPAPPAR